LSDSTSIIDLRLSSEQSALFYDTLSIQRQHKQSAIFAIITDSYIPAEGRGVIRLEAKLVSRRCASRIEKLIREDFLDTEKLQTGEKTNSEQE
jgi:hypothetical protein